MGLQGYAGLTYLSRAKVNVTMITLHLRVRLAHVQSMFCIVGVFYDDISG